MWSTLSNIALRQMGIDSPEPHGWGIRAKLSAPPVNVPISEDTSDLIRRATRRDTAALRWLIRRLMPVIQARVRRRLARHANRKIGTFDESDLVQEVWMVLIKDDARQLAQYDPHRGASLEGYVGMVAERVLSNIYQQVHAVKRQTNLGSVDIEKASPSDRSADPERTAGVRQTCIQLGNYLDKKLPPKGKVIFRYIYTDGMSPDETAKTLGVHRQVVYNWQHKIRKLAEDFINDR